MYFNAGFLHNSRLPLKDKSKPLIVSSCGTYRLINREKLPTWRPKGRLDYQIIYIAAGKAHFFFDNEEVVVPAGHMVLFQPKQEQHYEYYAEDKPEVFWVHFTGSDVKTILRGSDIPMDQRFFYTGVTVGYQHLFTCMIQELLNCRIGYENLLEMCLRQLLLLIQRNRAEQKCSISSLHQEEMEHARRYFHEHYNENIDIEQYAQSVHMSLCWFTRTFKAIAGCAPTKYITNIRIKTASQLLTSSEYPVSEIANIVGYANPFYFSRVFKRSVGMTPREYRKATRPQLQTPDSP